MVQYKASVFNVDITVDNECFVYNTLSGSCVSKPLYLELQRENQVILVNLQMIVPEKIDEFLKAKLIWQKSMHSVLERTFYIAPTLECNFQCPYCYAPHSNLIMDDKIGEEIVGFISNSASKAEKISINWIGGEPLLNANRIIKVNNDLRSHLTNVRLEIIVITNGYYLTTERAISLIESGVSTFVVTVDGNKAIHDNRRKIIDGHGTYDTIMSNISSCSKIANLIVRINVDDSNIENVPELIAELKHSEILERVIITLVPIQRFDVKKTYTSISDVSKKTLSRIAMIIEKERRVAWGGPDPLIHCCPGFKINDFAIDPDGDLYACPIHIGDKDRSIGNIFHRQPTAEYFSWYSDPAQKILKGNCSSCSYFPICLSACPLVKGKKAKDSRDCTCMIKEFNASIENYIRSHKDECLIN